MFYYFFYFYIFTVAVQDILHKDGLIPKIFSYLSHNIIKVVESALGMLSHCLKNEKIKKEFAPQFLPQLYCFLDFPHQEIKERASEIFISNFRKENGEIKLNEENLILALTNLLNSGGTVKNTTPFSFKLENNQLNISAPEFMFSFNYQTPTEQKRQFAKSLAKCLPINNTSQFFAELTKFQNTVVNPSGVSWKTLGFSSEQIMALFIYENTTGNVTPSEFKYFKEIFPELDLKSISEFSQPNFDKEIFENPSISIDKMNHEVLTFDLESPYEISYSLLYIGSVGSAITHIPIRGDGISSYFEVFILNEGTQRTISVGFSTENNFQNISHPGW